MTQQSQGPGKGKENTFIRDRGLSALLLLCFPSAEQAAAQWNILTYRLDSSGRLI